MDSSYSYLRQFTPEVLAAVDFTGGPGTADLMAAVAILKNLNASGGRKVPADAPASFVPARYAEYLEKARKAGDDTGFRHYWELCVILGLRDGLRSGDIFVPGSRRYADPRPTCYTPGQWAPRQGEYCRLVGKPARAADALAAGQGRAACRAGRAGEHPGRRAARRHRAVRLDDDDKLVIPQLTAEDSPPRPGSSRTSWPGCCRSRRSPRC